MPYILALLATLIIYTLYLPETLNKTFTSVAFSFTGDDRTDGHIVLTAVSSKGKRNKTLIDRTVSHC